ncbi:cupin domain-containing protein [Thermoflexus sp.]|uniref:cupin domain-containing protein n=2 Tax=Thermoflexus sp. TaxID=1969742 RepID=UPI002999DA16|nr:cupin domain-containing protein [Thermoflexus sp.]MDW8065211.1 cupin domain-containing protein [Anaerolineae bacterium]
MAKVFLKEQLPHWVSTRDTRDRLDLITEHVPVGATRLRADRIRYHPGDTSAKHFHTDCVHLFWVLEGNGLLHTGTETIRLSPGEVAIVGAGEVHWFENDTKADFVFVELWVPPPKETVWITDDQ